MNESPIISRKIVRKSKVLKKFKKNLKRNMEKRNSETLIIELIKW